MGQDQRQTSSLSLAHQNVAYWAALGHSIKEIAALSEHPESTVKSILKSEQVKAFINKVRFSLYKDHDRRLKVLGLSGMTVAEEIMNNKKVKPHTRLVAAQDFMDRAYGKPEQKMGLGEGIVRELLTMFQAQGSQKPIDTKDVTPNNDIEEAQYSEVSEPEQKQLQATEEKTDEVDDWINKNIK